MGVDTEEKFTVDDSEIQLTLAISNTEILEQLATPNRFPYPLLVFIKIGTEMNQLSRDGIFFSIPNFIRLHQIFPVWIEFSGDRKVSFISRRRWV